MSCKIGDRTLLNHLLRSYTSACDKGVKALEAELVNPGASRFGRFIGTDPNSMRQSEAQQNIFSIASDNYFSALHVDSALYVESGPFPDVPKYTEVAAQHLGLFSDFFSVIEDNRVKYLSSCFVSFIPFLILYMLFLYFCSFKQ